jgi:hypothetical protein
MAILEAHSVWTLTSTGTGKAVSLSPGTRQLSAYYETSSISTGTIQLQTRAGSSAGPYVGLSASTVISTGAVLLQQFSGPLEWVRPYCSALSTAAGSQIRVTLWGN